MVWLNIDTYVYIAINEWIDKYVYTAVAEWIEEYIYIGMNEWIDEYVYWYGWMDRLMNMAFSRPGPFSIISCNC